MSSTTEPLDKSTVLARLKSRLHVVYWDRLCGGCPIRVRIPGRGDSRQACRHRGPVEGFVV